MKFVAQHKRGGERGDECQVGEQNRAIKNGLRPK
jgi:hypothetical protein